MATPVYYYDIPTPRLEILNPAIPTHSALAQPMIRSEFMSTVIWNGRVVDENGSIPSNLKIRLLFRDVLDGLIPIGDCPVSEETGSFLFTQYLRWTFGISHHEVCLRIIQEHDGEESDIVSLTYSLERRNFYRDVQLVFDEALQIKR